MTMFNRRPESGRSGNDEWNLNFQLEERIDAISRVEIDSNNELSGPQKSATQPF